MRDPMSITFRRYGLRPAMAVVVLMVAGCAAPGAPSTSRATDLPIRIGAVFPLQRTAGMLARHELEGVRIAADLVNADGGVGGLRIELDVRDLESTQDAPAVMKALASAGTSIVVGSYSSDLSIAASRAADAAGLVYWEAGAAADRLTGEGLPMGFRVGASGANLGTNSAEFSAAELASRRGRPPATPRT